MNLKVLVTLSSLVVLTVLVVCVSVYAYNAYCTANGSTCRATASINGYGLFNGQYSVSATVDGQNDNDGDHFPVGFNVWDSAVKDLADGDCVEGSSSASVSGFDGSGQFHSKWDDADFRN